MATMQVDRKLRAFVILNARSGSCTAEEIRRILADRLGHAGLGHDVHELAEGDDLKSLVCRAASGGYDIVVAAGGDGTVSTVANALVGHETMLGIIPLGTTNVLARELGIPLEPDAACDLLAGAHSVAFVDAMKVGGCHYFTQLGIGVDAAMIRDTTVEEKKSLGVVAYVKRAIGHFLKARPNRLTISADGRQVRPRAIEVVVANSGALGASGLRWGPDIRAYDGRVDVCIFRALTALDHLGVFFSVLLGWHRADRNIVYLTAGRAVAVHSDRALPVQGDGELLGQTPVEIQVVPRAVRIIVPAEGPASS